MPRDKKVSVKYQNYTLIADIFYDNGFTIEADSWEDGESVTFRSKEKTNAIKQLQEWFENQIDKGRAPHLNKVGFSIEVKAPELLPSYRQSGVAFHTSKFKNRDRILMQGLIPNGSEDLDTLNASRLLDTLKPNWIPNWVKRSEAIYLHPHYENEALWSKDSFSVDLYAVKPSPKELWFGSQSIGGFCLFDTEADEEWVINHTKEVKDYFGKEYWKNSCSLEQYLQNRSHFKKKHKTAHIDEIIHMGSIPPSDIELIGYWDEDSIFHPLESFKKYVYQERQNDYKGILFLK